MNQIDLSLFDLIDIDLTQQAKEGIGVWEVHQLREQAQEILFKHGMGHLRIDLTP